MDDLRRLSVDAARRRGLGGVAVGLVREDQPPLVECLGVADRITGRRVAPDTVFRIASISKTLTAIGLMQLRDEGHFALDDPVNHYLKHIQVEPPSGAPAVTFRHLLTHTSGIGELPRVADMGRREAWGGGPPFTPPADLAELYRGTLQTDVAAGTKWAYANHGFAVLGELVQDISGRPFAEHMREHLLEPLGMEGTDYRRTDRAETLATGYHWAAGRLRPIKDYDVTLYAVGSVLSPLTDMLEYASWLARTRDAKPTGVLSPATLDEMMSPQFSIDPRLAGMGLAFFLDRFGAHRVCGHDGNNVGFASALLVAPDDHIGVVALTNTSTMLGAQMLAASVLRSFLGVPDPADLLPRAGVAPNPHLWPDLIGSYAPAPGFLTNFRTWQMTGGEVEVFVRDRRLHLRALSPIPRLRKGLELYATDDDDPLMFAVEIDRLVMPVVFRRDDTGRVNALCVGAPASATLHRRAPWRTTRRRVAVIAGVGLAASVNRARRARRPRSRGLRAP